MKVCTTNRRDRAYSLIEVMVAIVIVGGLLVAAIRTVGASRLTQYHTTERAHAHMLAQGMIEEIVQQHYDDPNGGAGLGPDSGEGGSSARQHFDDVDDYHGWSASAPTERDGTALSAFDGWTREVTINYANATAPMQNATSDTGVKRITVRVKRGDAVLAEMTALRTRATPTEPANGAFKR